jgi:hypothetical protein
MSVTQQEIEEAEAEMDELLECGDLEDQLDAALRLADIRKRATHEAFAAPSQK